jgi:hypothetical protein
MSILQSPKSNTVHNNNNNNNNNNNKKIQYSEGLTVHLYDKVVLIFQQDVTI